MLATASSNGKCAMSERFNHPKLEIEQTMRFERCAYECDVARYRVWVFASIVAVTLIVETLLRDRAPEAVSWVPSLYYLGGVAYALVLRRLFQRYGAPVKLVLCGLMLDLVASVGLFPIMEHVHPSTLETKLFPIYLVAPTLLVLLVLNTLRYHGRLAIAGCVVASLLFIAVMRLTAGFNGAQIGLVGFMLVVGLIGVAEARRVRRGLDRFARMQLLRRYLSPTAIERVLRDDLDIAMALGGRLCTVTLLAADLRGFTTMSERLSPDEVVRQLNAYHEAVLAPIPDHGGILDKYIGDGSLVVFGLGPQGDVLPDHGALAAVECAQQMIKALDEHNAERARQSQPPLAMGIGIHTGPVISGNIGSPGLRLDFTVIGDAVNTAARLEGLTKEAGVPVLVSCSTVNLLASREKLSGLPPQRIRGKSEALEVFTFTEMVPGELIPIDARFRACSDSD
jgi:adenylate cyclase